ncbi:MAG: TetR/AcrR family transcriptional regulator [Halioglobus sp.]
MATAKPGKKNEAKEKSADGISWQAQKSAMTRDRILDAAIDCFINLGYTKVTTAKVSDFAGVSRGAMLHHFPSKIELIRSAIEYLHEKLLQDYTKKVSKIPKNLGGIAQRRAGLDAYWDHLNADLFVAYHELCIAGRTDPELQEILEQSVSRFEEHIRQTNNDLFAEWNDRGERYLLAMDLTKFLMEGMAVGQIGQDRDLRINRLLDYLADRLEEIFTESGSTAMSRNIKP